MAMLMKLVGSIVAVLMKLVGSITEMKAVLMQCGSCGGGLDAEVVPR
ncbi:hypothetical protein COCON_G00138960 [Conger conger]|uniref:Uncharacterized protein n=1 Tax=Conger conger TaxID=82655 RepID=A0A9Q1HTQ1_CONCO|nr:hypothetical protein COCON_G00138960 [Conger conger]